MLQSFFSTWWICILPCIGYDLYIPHKMSLRNPESDPVINSEVRVNQNPLSIKHLENMNYLWAGHGSIQNY